MEPPGNGYQNVLTASPRSDTLLLRVYEAKDQQSTEAKRLKGHRTHVNALGSAPGRFFRFWGDTGVFDTRICIR